MDTHKETLDAALGWLEIGVPVIPLQPMSKRIERGYGPRQKQITTPGECWFWFHSHSSNLGLCTGGAAGLVVLDFDEPSAYYDWLTACPKLNKTYTVATRRGFHVYLIVGDIPSGRAGQIEIKATGACIVAAPSVLPGGLTYRPLVEGAPILRASPVDLPLLSEFMAENVDRMKQRVKLAVTGKGDLIGRIKSAWPILDLARSMTKLKTRGGRWWHGLCPFHSEREPSFWIDTDTGTFGCFACGAHGDTVNLFALRHKLTVQEAIREMARKIPR